MRRLRLLLFLFLPNLAWALNTPDISANALFLYRNSNFNKEDTNTTRNGLDLQEAELNFFTDVDPYSRFNMILAVAPTYIVTGATTTQGWDVHPEELFAESTQLPDVLLKLGIFKAAFGKHNLLHTHAFPLVDAPMINTAVFGDALADPGVSAAILLPSPWFSELTIQYLRGAGAPNYNTEFNSPTPGDGVGVLHWKNLWDLTDEMTFEVGGSFAGGKNSFYGNTSITGADLTVKWRPEKGGLYHSWMFASEYITRAQDQSPGSVSNTENISGSYGLIQYQWAERWSGAARLDSLLVAGSNAGLNTNSQLNGTTSKYSAGVNYAPSEFSNYRIEYDWSDGPKQTNGETSERKIYLQANYLIGSHPAHAY
jgi:hypothetical protein